MVRRGKVAAKPAGVKTKNAAKTATPNSNKNSEVQSLTKKTRKRRSSGAIEAVNNEDHQSGTPERAVPQKRTKVAKTATMVSTQGGTRSRSVAAEAKASNFERNNNFVTTEFAGDISDSDNEQDREVSESEDDRTLLGGEDTPPSSQSSSECASHDQFEHVEATSKLDCANAQLREAHNMLDVLQKYMLKKGIISSSMMQEEVMDLMNKEAQSDSDGEPCAKQGSNSRSRTRSRSKSRAKPKRLSKHDESEYESDKDRGSTSQSLSRSRLKSKKRKSRHNASPGKQPYYFQSPSETTIYRDAVPCKETMANSKHGTSKQYTDGEITFRDRNSDSSLGVVDTSDEINDMEDDDQALSFLTDPRRYSRDSRSSRSHTQEARSLTTLRSRSVSRGSDQGDHHDCRDYSSSPNRREHRGRHRPRSRSRPCGRSCGKCRSRSRSCHHHRDQSHSE